MYINAHPYTHSFIFIISRNIKLEIHVYNQPLGIDRYLYIYTYISVPGACANMHKKRSRTAFSLAVIQRFCVKSHMCLEFS